MSSTPSRAPASARPVLRVLMVDDAPGFCRTVGLLLAREGDIEFQHCQELESALRLAREFEPSVILQDLVMPGVDGLDMIREYRRLPGVEHVPVIVLSAADAPEHKTAAFLVGADDYVRKDAQLVELLARVRYHAGRFLAMKREGLHRHGRAARAHVVRLLVIEPTKVGRSVIGAAFGHEPDVVVRFCADDRAALRAADEMLPTVVVVSLFGGAYDGFELIARLRAKRSTHDVPIVFYTSTDDPALKSRAFQSGANDYAIRTADFHDLIARVKRHSARHFAARQARLAASVGGGPVEADRLKVLLIAEDPEVGRSIGAMLVSERSVDLRTIDATADVVAEVRGFQPTVALLDLDMQQTDGLTLLRSLRDDPAGDELPIVALSSTVDPGANARAFALGASDHVDKRVDKIEFLSRLHHHARAHLSARELRRTLSSAMDMQRRVEVQSDFIRRTFGRYLSDGVVEAILEAPEGLELGGASRTVTLMMTDLRGFTALSETLPPKTVIEVLNGYFEVMTRVLMRHEATIDEFIGDAILAVFNAPNDLEDHAARAIACALEMQNAMTEVNAELVRRGLPELEMGIGLNTGEVVVGNVGSERRTKYGVVGRNVNLTSRIESFTVGGQVLAADSTVASSGGLAVVRGSRSVEPKGVKGSVVVHDVVAIRGRYDVALAAVDESLVEWSVPLLANVYTFDEKVRASTPLAARIIACGRRGLALDLSLSVDENLQIAICDPGGAVLSDDVFGKVVRATAGRSEVRLTSLGAGALAALRAHAGQ